MHRLAATVAAALAAAVVASPSGVDATVSRASGLALRKGLSTGNQVANDAAEPPPLLGTLVQTHTTERVPLDALSPTADRFATLLADRVTGEHHAFDPRLLTLLRALAERHRGARFELVSGYRSPKLNEMMRKKGHHVASHSQHSLGHAVDFRIVERTIHPEGRPGGAAPSHGDEEKGIDPRILEREIRELGWEGGIGVYTLESDWFVHADVGNRRRWDG